MIDRQLLLKDLQRQVKSLESDLRQQIEDLDHIGGPLHVEYDEASKKGRTAATWSVWRDERVTQVAAAWVLGTVFVRFCEDNGLLADPYLAGPDTERLTLAEEAHAQFFRDSPHETHRGWLFASFNAIAETQPGRLLFDSTHNAAYQIPISADAARDLITFWRRRGEDGHLIHDFQDDDWDTRFLGDLYQDLSEAARKRYALLQTPEFVEEFILDLTLKPAINEFGYDVVKMIDPTCGSGHFLLGTFHHLLKEWEEKAPALDQYERVNRALNAVHGVDINPYAVAIARFRLLVAALRACNLTTFADMNGRKLPLHVAIGDSLIKHRQLELDLPSIVDELADHRYAVEDLDDHPGILTEGQYHVVVGNPPYITVKDKNLNEAYRQMYSACSGKYALSVPYAQRFFQLAMRSSDDGKGSGYVSQITANSFMKREFGKDLIQNIFARKVALTHVIDTSGAYIPSHGTPTVIFIGRNRERASGDRVRAVLGIRGEPSAPPIPREGLVWRSIVSSIGVPGLETEWVSVLDLSSSLLASHPWSLSGGGASELLEVLERDNFRLSSSSRRIGVLGMTNADDVMLAPRAAWLRRAGNDASNLTRRLVVGDELRDWQDFDGDHSFFPYDESFTLQDLGSGNGCYHWLWPCRTVMGNRATFAKETYFFEGRPWYEWHQLTRTRHGHAWTIVFSFVATHNHFVLDRGGKVYNRSAPVIKLGEEVGEEEHLRLLGVLNSSTACFWLKQMSHGKGNGGVNEGYRGDEWEEFYEFTGTKLQEFPLPAEYPLKRARELDGLAQQLSAVSPAAVAIEGVPTRERLAGAREEWHAIRARMIAVQEELDWEVYRLYGLLDDDLTTVDVPELKLGERAFEIVLARKMARGEVETQWFARHGSTPITELPGHWPAAYGELVEKRIEVIENDRGIGLIERPECKRRWATEGFDAMQAKALRGWLLDRCEARELWYHHVDGMEEPRPRTVNELADALRRDADVMAVAELYAPGKDFTKVITDLVADEHVPFLAALRYKPSGLAKRADWEHVWDMQRAEDAAPDELGKKQIRDKIPVPPKYGSGDFLKTSYWRQRGKLDVPKERFISYPHAGRDSDPSLLLGWAGWDHRDQAQALAILIVDREQNDGWDAPRLTPLAAGLREVLPWVRQWHNDFDSTYGDSPANTYDAFLTDLTTRHHLTATTLTTWHPPTTPRGRRPKA